MDHDKAEHLRNIKLKYYKLMGQAYDQIPKDKLSPYAYMVTELVKNPALLHPYADIRTYRAFVETNGNFCESPLKSPDALQKSSVRAAKLRQSGNEFYRQKQYNSALKQYNMSICAAPTESEDLAIGYANRSAVFYEQKYYGVALVNIDLAKKHNYPERLMAKLLVREANCKLKLVDRTNETIPSVVLEPNQRIPFLADGIHVQHPTNGPIMVAERNFKAGDMILREKPMVACVNENSVFERCNYCVSKNLLHLIPCPDCTWAMFCNEDCLRQGQKLHRFECGICPATSKLNNFWMAPRLFFHGLTLFEDDVTKMIEFYAGVQGNTVESFFDLDYAHYDPLDEFRALLTVKCRRDAEPLYDNILQLLSATIYGLCMKVPLVQSLIRTAEQQDFMQLCFVDFLRRSFTILQTEYGHLFPIASCFGHSCDPNTIVLENGNELRMIVQRPILRGEQIRFSYGPKYTQDVDTYLYMKDNLGFICECDFCDKDKRKQWVAKANQANSFDPAAWKHAKMMAYGFWLPPAEKMNGLQQFIQRYGSCHPQEDFAEMVRTYAIGLDVRHSLEMYKAMERKICG